MVAAAVSEMARPNGCITHSGIDRPEWKQIELGPLNGVLLCLRSHVSPSS